MSTINKFNEIINDVKENTKEDSSEFSKELISKLNEKMSLVELEEIQDDILDTEMYSETIKIAFTSVVFNKTTKNIAEMMNKVDLKNAEKIIPQNQDPSTSVLLGLINFSCFIGLCFILS